MLQEMLEGEHDGHLGYEKYEHSGESEFNSPMATAARAWPCHLEAWRSAFPGLQQRIRAADREEAPEGCVGYREQGHIDIARS